MNKDAITSRKPLGCIFAFTRFFFLQKIDTLITRNKNKLIDQIFLFIFRVLGILKWALKAL